MAQRRAKRNPPWTRDELILALDLYFRYKPPTIPKSHPEILSLSTILNSLPIHEHRPDREHFRSPSGVYMKLCNFLRFDPSYDGKGLTAGNRLEEEVWSDYAEDRQYLRATADRIRSVVSSPDAPVPEVDAEEEAVEGRILLACHKRRERNAGITTKKKRSFLKKHGSLFCEVCGFDFESTYGEIGEGFIECHHIRPLAEAEPNGRTRLEDLALLCANCHRIIHRGARVSTLPKLREAMTGGRCVGHEGRGPG